MPEQPVYPSDQAPKTASNKSLVLIVVIGVVAIVVAAVVAFMVTR